MVLVLGIDREDVLVLGRDRLDSVSARGRLSYVVREIRLSSDGATDGQTRDSARDGLFCGERDKAG